MSLTSISEWTWDIEAIYTARPRGMDSMKSRIIPRHLIASILAAFIALSVPLGTLAADELQAGSSATVGGTGGSGLRVRSGPGPTSNVLATLLDGESVEITGAPIETGGLVWYPVKTAKARGWSNAEYLRPPSGDSLEIMASARSELVAADSGSGPEIRLFQLLNEARAARGLNPLAWNAELARASTTHAQDMARRGYMEHTNPDGQDPRDRAFKAGYIVPPRSPWLVIETISARATPEAAMEWLLSHQQHAGVLLRPNWREAGAGYVKGGPYGQFWVMNFGCRPNVLPAFASAGKADISVDITLTNELCTPNGQGEYMGKAVDVQISPNQDFSGADWEPFATLKTVKNPSTRMFVKLRDAQGRTTQNDLNITGVVTAAGKSEPIKR
jgi:uncharacterized protein YkwD